VVHKITSFSESKGGAGQEPKNHIIQWSVKAAGRQTSAGTGNHIGNSKSAERNKFRAKEQGTEAVGEGSR